MGLLQVSGTIDLTQFWGSGGDSDADTAHVAVEAITYEGAPVNVFDKAYVRGRGQKAVINKGGITVRWQGIDAPELHFGPTVAKDKRAVESHIFRQHYGRAATVALHAHLKTLAKNGDSIACKVMSEVEKPNDVFDTYGRLIGDVLVGNVNLNLWLVEHGWAFPAFYASMTDVEITSLRNAATTAREKRRGIWDGFTQELSFDYDLRHEKNGSANDPDGGPVLFPKIFRRLSTEYVLEGGIDDFEAYLRSQKQQDHAYLLEEYLDQGPSAALQHNLAEFVSGGAVTFRPADLVFVEAPSTLYDQNGRKIRSW